MSTPLSLRGLAELGWQLFRLPQAEKDILTLKDEDGARGYAMAQGLWMTSEGWLELKSKVDDSFWAMRVIGYPPLPTDDEGFSCGAH
ncbi:hypothetical protein C0993_003690, partial [Termitomyces sp. T159_Od127]